MSIYSTISKLIGILKSTNDAKIRDNVLKTLWELGQSKLPCGGGIDSGTSVDADESHLDRLVFRLEFHEMEEGYYTGWIPYKVIVTPTFDGVSVDVEGPDSNGLRDYIADTFLLLDGEPG